MSYESDPFTAAQAAKKYAIRRKIMICEFTAAQAAKKMKLPRWLIMQWFTAAQAAKKLMPQVNYVM